MSLSGWIDTHCHLDAPEFQADASSVVARARTQGVRMMVLPAVRVADFPALRELAHRHHCAYALGIHPLCVQEASTQDLALLEQALKDCAGDPLLVAVGEIGLDHFVEGLDRAKQYEFYIAQLRMAQSIARPVILHVRRSADHLLKGLRQYPVPGGIAHAFNGSDQQAQQFLQQGFALGFGGTLTFDRSLQIRHLAATLPPESIVLETDAPDIPPQWLYRPAALRSEHPPVRNEPAELPRIAQSLAELRGWSVEHTAALTTANACRVLPGLQSLMDGLA